MAKISSAHNPRYKAWLKLKTLKGRREHDLFLVEGIHLVEEALKAKRVETLLVREGQTLDAAVETFELSDALIDRLCSTQSKEDVIAICTLPQMHTPAQRILICEDIQDPGNLGSLMRSARAFGYDTILCSTAGCDPHHPKVIRATQGAFFQLNIERLDLYQNVEKLKHDGWMIVGSALDTHTHLDAIRVPAQHALIVAHEGQGMSPALRTLCSHVVRIDAPHFESLNVAVAGGILMHALRFSTTND